MGILDFFSGGVIEAVGHVADELVTSDEERAEKENEKLKTNLNYKLEQSKIQADLIKNENQNVTTRWLSDNQNLITRMVRPFVVIYLVVMFTLIVLFDGNVGSFTINEDYIPIYQTLLLTVIGAYFGSRGYEKVISIKSGGKKSEV